MCIIYKYYTRKEGKDRNLKEILCYGSDYIDLYSKTEIDRCRRAVLVYTFIKYQKSTTSVNKNERY